MLRIYKVYAFDYYPQKVVTIASSPGLLHSKDDFLASPTLCECTHLRTTANCIIIDHFSAFESGLVAPFLYAA
jgi:hypothetical protein